MGTWEVVTKHYRFDSYYFRKLYYEITMNNFTRQIICCAIDKAKAGIKEYTNDSEIVRMWSNLGQKPEYKFTTLIVKDGKYKGQKQYTAWCVIVVVDCLKYASIQLGVTNLNLANFSSNTRLGNAFSLCKDLVKMGVPHGTTPKEGCIYWRHRLDSDVNKNLTFEQLLKNGANAVSSHVGFYMGRNADGIITIDGNATIPGVPEDTVSIVVNPFDFEDKYKFHYFYIDEYVNMTKPDNLSPDCNKDEKKKVCEESDWSPSLDQYCNDFEVIQTCYLTGETRRRLGTKDCSIQECLELEWSPKADTICQGVIFEQTCYKTSVKRQAVGTKPCSPSESTDCIESDWFPLATEWCIGQAFVQVCSKTGASRTAVGTKQCNENVSCPDGLRWNPSTRKCEVPELPPKTSTKNCFNCPDPKFYIKIECDDCFDNPNLVEVATNSNQDIAMSTYEGYDILPLADNIVGNVFDDILDKLREVGIKQADGFEIPPKQIGDVIPTVRKFDTGGNVVEQKQQNRNDIGLEILLNFIQGKSLGLDKLNDENRDVITNMIQDYVSKLTGSDNPLVGAIGTGVMNYFADKKKREQQRTVEFCKQNFELKATSLTKHYSMLDRRNKYGLPDLAGALLRVYNFEWGADTLKEPKSNIPLTQVNAPQIVGVQKREGR